MTHYDRTGEDIERGLISHLKLDDLKVPGVTKAIDRARFDDGVISGATNANGKNWNPGNSMSFDGTDSISISGNEVNEITVAFWFKPNDVSSNMGFLGDSGYSRIMYARSQYVSGFFYIQDSNANNVLIGYCLDDVEDEWTHMVFSVSGRTATLYVNGEYCGSEDFFDGDDLLFKITVIGEANGDLFDGEMESVRIYDRGLSKGEISKLHRLRR